MACDEVVYAEYAQVCQARADRTASDDIWQALFHWQRIKVEFQNALAAGKSRFGLRIAGQLVGLCGSADAVVQWAVTTVSNAHLSSVVSSWCRRVQRRDRIKSVMREAAASADGFVYRMTGDVRSHDASVDHPNFGGAVAAVGGKGSDWLLL